MGTAHNSGLGRGVHRLNLRLKAEFVMVMLIVALVGSGPREARAQSAQDTWSGIENVIAFADVHGAYTELETLLRETGVVDAQDRWAAGPAHVVSLGDLLDRGRDSRKVMDLLMRLQGEAQAAGGQLHVLLGNHEAMNLLGDLRYVDAGEFASYADLDSAADHIDQNFPPGYFGRRAAFSPQGKYGKWLLTLPVAIMINETLFMHAGPASVLRGMSLPELNRRYRTALIDYLELYTQLEQAKLLQVGDAYEARPQLAKDRFAAASAPQGSRSEAELRATIQRFEAAANNALLSESGPNWYRGPALCNEATETDVLSPLLQQYGATRLVVGHTPTRNARVATRFNGRVVKLDTGMNHAVYKGRAAALFIEPSGLSVRYAGQPDAAAPEPEGLYVAPNQLDDASVLATLRDGEVTVTGPRGPNELNVLVGHGNDRTPAVFQVRSTSDISKEVAAYRLDRLMGLGLVPVTVARTVQGMRGTLQGRPLKWVTQAEVQQQGLHGGGWCSMEPQFQLMYAFDTLTGNEGRTAESIVMDSDDWFVYATRYERAFGTTRGLPTFLKAKPPTPGVEVRRRMGTLDQAGLSTALGDLLDARARAAILARRDVLLALPAAAEAKAP